MKERRSLPDLTGETLKQVDRDYTLRMHTTGGWLIATGDEAVVNDKDLAAALYGAVGKPIRSFKIKRRVLSFKVGDAVVRVEPDPHYESWEVIGPGPLKERVMVICMPGGELAIWS